MRGRMVLNHQFHLHGGLLLWHLSCLGGEQQLLSISRFACSFVDFTLFFIKSYEFLVYKAAARAYF
jgi:hypothetical protein